MIYIKITRTAFCDVCGWCWDLYRGDPVPPACKRCGSTRWNGEADKGQLRIRHGIAYAREPINPGATSLKRQTQGKRQWRRFKPKPDQVDASSSPG